MKGGAVSRREPSLEALAQEEQRTANRLATYRAKLYRGSFATPQVGRLRLDELQRAHQAALGRLRRARERTP
jgi:hypothetical protein